MPFAVRLRKTNTSVSAPARRNAFSLSSSQFVPGKDGMNTRGLAICSFARAALRVSQGMNGAVVCLAFASVGKTLSSGSLHAPCASERLRVMPQAESVALPVVTPISRSPAGTGAPAFSSTTMPP